MTIVRWFHLLLFFYWRPAVVAVAHYTPVY